jgi:aminopeptidase N
MICRCIVVAAMLSSVALIFQTAHAAVLPAPECELDITFDIGHSKIAGATRIHVLEGRALRFRVGHLTIRKVAVNRKPARFQVRDGTLTITPAESGNLEIDYEGVFEPSGAIPAPRDTDIPGAIGREGIFLATGWYPRIAGPATYRLNAVLPRGYVAVSEAEAIQEHEASGSVAFGFQFNHPVYEISFVATDRYQVIQDRFQGVELWAYFFPEDQTLARKYLDYAKKYIQLYETLLLPFPFHRFAIVENFLPTGYSMPTYTLLGQGVVRLPFIVETSLGHEVLHQWFGNQVYGSEQGNWTEGLTTYLADHLYEERKGEGWRYRRQMLIDYRSYVHDDNDFPLMNFTSRFDAATRSIGYGKAAMVFHMLRQMLGDKAFFGALKAFLREKQFQRASWDDLRTAFQRQSGRELGWFFDQWIRRKGLPELSLSDFTLEPGAGAFVLNFDLGQKGEIYRLDVPVKVRYRPGGEKNLRLRLDEREKRVRIKLEKEPDQIIIDDNFDMARQLTEPEVPPVLASFLGAKKRIVVLPVRDESYYRDVISGLRARGAEVKAADALSDAEIRSATLAVLGRDHPVVRRLYGKVDLAAAGFNVLVKKNPWNPTNTVGIISAGSAAEAKAAFRKIFHYGKYSQLAFENGRNVSATVAASERGIQKSLNQNPPAVDLSTLKSLSDVVERLALKKIVYVGEEHDKFSHHQVQLEILRALYRQNPKIAVGMEMFQTPSQQALDDYIAGAIDERGFLKRSEYFKQWNIDYNLYKPILDFAREKRLPVIALNLRREVVDQVAKGGLNSLTKEEKQQIPQQLDFSDQEYRARLREVFAAHQRSEEKNFEFFYQAQILWDETMAESIDRFLKKHPDFRVLVLAGAGHLQYGSGIPKRSFRRNGLDYAIVLSDAGAKKEIADFVVFPEESKAPIAPRLGVAIEEEKQEVRIAGFAKDSVAEKAGLKVDDTLVSLDDYPVSSAEDVRIALFYKHAGDTIKIKARRGTDELEFNVRLQ